MWLVTGGHPALAQIICNYVFREWTEQKHQTGKISLPLIQRATFRAVNDPNLRGYFDYVFSNNLSKTAQTSLREALKKNTSEETGQDRYDHLTGVIELQGSEELLFKEFFSYENGRHYLRIGFFYLWLNR